MSWCSFVVIYEIIDFLNMLMANSLNGQVVLQALLKSSLKNEISHGITHMHNNHLWLITNLSHVNLPMSNDLPCFGSAWSLL